eukprot:TRINITY_DN161_c0_g1_i4.p1 TRINITY_DN161_c0_g1~~TRINITY_DN161_c0_g1_i4.p1  ORF type:complete len:452 (+),score=169.44 TRINITY_DN161_c0_g1_i4:132-1487(+)
MSIDLLYPDNRPRGSRVEALANDIKAFQADCVDEANSMDKIDLRIRPLMDQVMLKYGFKTFDQLVESVKSMLSEEDRKKLEKTLEEFKNIDSTTDTTFSSTMIVTFVIGLPGSVGARVARMIVAGVASHSFRLFAKGMRAIFLVGDLALGLRYIRLAGRFAASAAEVGAGMGGATARLVSRLGRLIKFADVLAVIGILIDGIILIYAAIEGARQRDELRKAIKDLFARRLGAKIGQLQAKAAATYSSNIHAMLLAMSLMDHKPGANNDALNAIIKSQEDNMISNLQSDMDGINYDEATKLLTAMDTGRYTTEDPTKEEAIKMLEEEILPQIPFKYSSQWFNPAGGANHNPFQGGNWNAGAGPVQWIEADFKSVLKIKGISMECDQVPEGHTRHVITVGTSPNPSEVVATLEGNTKNKQILSANWAEKDIQYVRITTTASSTWVAWTDIQFA